MDWFLYDNGLRFQRVKQTIHSVNSAMARQLMYYVVEKMINQSVYVWDMRY